MSKDILSELELKEKFLECYADVHKYRLNISKILKDLDIPRQKFDFWCSKKDFIRRFKEAQKNAADNLLEEYVSLFIDNKDRQAGETILALLDPLRFDKGNIENKDSIQNLIIEITRNKKEDND